MYIDIWRKSMLCSNFVQSFHGLVLVILTAMTLKISGCLEVIYRVWYCQSPLDASQKYIL